MLELQRKQKNKDGQKEKHQDRFCCTITCRYGGKDSIMRMNAT